MTPANEIRPLLDLTHLLELNPEMCVFTFSNLLLAGGGGRPENLQRELNSSALEPVSPSTILAKGHGGGVRGRGVHARDVGGNFPRERFGYLKEE